MKLLLVVVTPDQVMQNLINRGKEELIPASMRSEIAKRFPGVRLTLTCFLGVPGRSEDEILSFMRERMNDQSVNGAVIAVDDRLNADMQSLRNTCFVFRYASPGLIRSPQNFFGSKLSKAINNYLYFARRFSDLKDQKILCLPIRNFIAAEFAILRQVCANSDQQESYIDALDAALKNMRARQKPKRFKDRDIDSSMYIVDEEEKHFQKGHEHHARADTKMPPHNDLCVMGINFRFGCRLDGDLHYNVSMGPRDQPMTGMYLDCHGVARSGQSRKHLNMFSNDFF